MHNEGVETAEALPTGADRTGAPGDELLHDRLSHRYGFTRDGVGLPVSVDGELLNDQDARAVSRFFDQLIFVAQKAALLNFAKFCLRAHNDEASAFSKLAGLFHQQRDGSLVWGYRLGYLLSMAAKEDDPAMQAAVENALNPPLRAVDDTRARQGETDISPSCLNLMLRSPADMPLYAFTGVPYVHDLQIRAAVSQAAKMLEAEFAARRAAAAALEGGGELLLATAS